MFDPREIGHRIKQRREELDLTLEDVASTVKVARSTIQRYEAGTIGRPKLPVLYSISQALCVSPDWLLGIIDEPPPPLCGWDGSTLRDLRKNNGESTAQVADAIGVREELYCQYESGTSEPSISYLDLLADHFCVSVDTILQRNFYIVEGEKIVTGNFRITKEEKFGIELYRQASSDDKAVIQCVLNKYRKNVPASADKAM